METYNPSTNPDPKEWKALDESEQLRLVQDYHAQMNEEVTEGSEIAHAGIHVIVENQIATDVEPVPATISKLIRQGLSRHEAIHAVGAIICEDLYDLLHSREETWNLKKYRRRLEKLTAKRWSKGQW